MSILYLNVAEQYYILLCRCKWNVLIVALIEAIVNYMVLWYSWAFNIPCKSLKMARVDGCKTKKLFFSQFPNPLVHECEWIRKAITWRVIKLFKTLNTFLSFKTLPDLMIFIKFYLFLAGKLLFPMNPVGIWKRELNMVQRNGIVASVRNKTLVGL